ncbi:VQ motif-containing protein 4 [Raphanus sativus]|uniref:VQ motif-containing protein 4 n=1 Tax=Raphanus sativus TaxID=3726 RepID=A0A6J0NQ80_RAPSA|nr:VQ motif-containing protein 4 [Raphanus sativus]KAJ4894738.1 VQ motif-containing protein 4 [Raphanus sativus]
MENSPRYRDASTNLIPSPRCHNNSSCSMNSSTESNKPPITPTRHVTTRSESGNPYPTTFVQADTSSFKQVVQMLTGSSDRPKQHNTSSLKPNPAHQPDPRSSPSQFSIPAIKAVNKKQSSSSSGFRLYERRNSMKNLKINPLDPVFNPVFSPRKPEILSPSILDFPSLVLSPVTPLIPDPFNRSGSSSQSPDDAEEKAMKEKGFYLHPSPATTPMDSEPRLLPLFPVTSPRVPGSSTDSSS